MTKRQGRPQSRNDQRRHRLLRVVIVAVAVAAAGAIWYVFARNASVSGSTLEQWVRDQNFEPLRPMRSSFLPGTLVFVSAGGRDRIAMAAEDFLKPGQATPSVG